MYIKDFNFNLFHDDEEMIDAVVGNFEIIGEAANRISPDFRNINLRFCVNHQEKKLFFFYFRNSKQPCASFRESLQFLWLSFSFRIKGRIWCYSLREHKKAPIFSFE